MIYKAKTLFTGYKIGLKTPWLYVGVPTKYINGAIAVEHEGKRKLFLKEKSVTKKTFNDRFRPNKTYTLAYFLWERVKKSEVNN